MIKGPTKSYFLTIRFLYIPYNNINIYILINMYLTEVFQELLDALLVRRRDFAPAARGYKNKKKSKKNLKIKNVGNKIR